MICGIGKVDERDSDGISLAISCDGREAYKWTRTLDISHDLESRAAFPWDQGLGLGESLRGADRAESQDLLLRSCHGGFHETN